MPLDEVRPGETITAAWANAVVRAVQRTLRVTVAAPLQAHQDATGLHLSLGAWPQWELCELTEELSAGGSAAAKRKVFQGGDWVDVLSGQVVVYDSLGDKNGVAGDRLWAFFSPKSCRWEIVQLAC